MQREALPPSWMIGAAVREGWAAGELAAVAERLRLGGLELERRAGGIGVVGGASWQPLRDQPEPVLAAIRRLLADAEKDHAKQIKRRRRERRRRSLQQWWSAAWQSPLEL